MNKAQGITFIGAGTRLEGELVLESAALVAGELRGRIESCGQIKIEPSGIIDGDLHCHELRVCGTFRGKLRCQKLVIVNGGVVEGEVASNEMEIFDGGQFLGSRTRGPEPVAGEKAPMTPLPEGGRMPLKSLSAIAASLAIAWVVFANPQWRDALSESWQALTAATPDAAMPSPESSAAAAVVASAETGTEPARVETDGDMSGSAGYIQEDNEAMDTASALLLEQSPLEQNALAQQPVDAVGASQEEVMPGTDPLNLELPSDMGAPLSADGSAEKSDNRLIPF